jgi:hypothetical protein
MKFIFSAFLLFTFICQAAEKAQNSWSSSMRELLKTMAEIEPLLFDSSKFNDPKEKDFLQKKIHELAATSKNVKHDPTIKNQDPTVRFVASQFSQDLQSAEQSFSEGRTAYARYQLMKVTSSCVQCHTRMPNGPQYTFKKTEAFIQNMPLLDRAEFLIASRRFNEAYDFLKKGLSEGKLPAWQLDRAAGLAMLIAVQFENDAKKAQGIVDEIQKGKTLPPFLKEKGARWQNSLKQWMNEKAEPSLTDIKKPLESRDEVAAMRAIPKVLIRLSKELSAKELGEALLLAGQSYEILNEISPLQLHENYYESCIHQVPHSAIAKKCFAKLENSVRIGYSGSSGTHIPLDVQAWLEQLKKKSD